VRSAGAMPDQMSSAAPTASRTIGSRAFTPARDRRETPNSSTGGITPTTRARSNSSSTARRPSEPRSIENAFHIEVDVLIHHLFAHLLRMFADERKACRPVRKRVLNAPTHNAVSHSA
jgi:hypothetical protein